MLQRRTYLVLKRSTPYRLSALWVVWGRGRWAASLDHEARDQSVKGRLVVVVRCTERKEILQQYALVLCVPVKVRVEMGEEPTSVVLGTLSQKTSILRSPKLVCRVTDMV